MLLGTGFVETEAIAPLDLLRRAGVTVLTVGIQGKTVYGGHSIGIPLATASKYSFVAESATMTMHPMRMSGLVIGAEQTYEYFRRMQDRIVDFITSHSRVAEEEFRRLLLRPDEIATDVGSIIDGAEAARIGLIDEVGGLSDALCALRSMIRAEA